ncbi:hypothetical protein [Thermoflavimicrobium dichotomicum]|uniref:Uncharacterized protein n=1 Tax=Thermoflavimicrobium dichotomicum TaxID=46223 RepID=A0A1I3UIH8_9BACL|nr:hypothetical protein [Thermoflavimicrobium dichotomicum]SFJ82513.1 hypothetical protein SAMN05421852_1258 [Thermoflavimicrobium dichotomicum]
MNLSKSIKKANFDKRGSMIQRINDSHLDKREKPSDVMDGVLESESEGCEKNNKIDYLRELMFDIENLLGLEATLNWSVLSNELSKTEYTTSYELHIVQEKVRDRLY